VKYADDRVILAKEETVLPGEIDKTDWNWTILWTGNECGKKYGN